MANWKNNKTEGDEDQAITRQENNAGPYVGFDTERFPVTNQSIKEDLENTMSEHQSELDASKVNVDVKNFVVTLTGSVPNDNQKLLVDEIAESTRG